MSHLRGIQSFLQEQSMLPVIMQHLVEQFDGCLQLLNDLLLVTVSDWLAVPAVLWQIRVNRHDFAEEEATFSNGNALFFQLSTSLRYGNCNSAFQSQVTPASDTMWQSG